MSIPPKRSQKIYDKLQRLSGLQPGDYAKIIEPLTRWRQAINLHHRENGTKFNIRTTPEGVFICRER